jgi:hypothetical protein
LKEALNNAQQEVRRADHLFHVTLKYTRTVDVLKSLIDRLINAIDYGIEALLISCKEQGKVTVIPKLPRIRIELIQKNYADDKEIMNYIEFFMLLRKITKAKFDRAQEYRRHVTMTAHFEEQQAEITIDIIGDYFRKTKEFLDYVSEVIQK